MFKSFQLHGEGQSTNPHRGFDPGPPLRLWPGVPLPPDHRSRIQILRIFSCLKFNEFNEFFIGWKHSQKNRNFTNHRCLTCFDVLECNVHLGYDAFIRTTDHCKVQTAFVSLFYIFIDMKPWNALNSSVVVGSLHAHSGI